jgi:hypothetical protein
MPWPIRRASALAAVAAITWAGPATASAYRTSPTTAPGAGLPVAGTAGRPAPPLPSSHPVSAPSPGPSSRTVLLVNGDRLVVGADRGGPHSVTVLPGGPGGLAGSVQAIDVRGQVYEIPAAAVPFLGRGLDPGLFQLSALERLEAGGRLLVRLSYRGHLPTLPGVRITGSGRGAAEGYLTAASARKFGAALDRQFVADHARGSYGSDGLFSGGVTISLAGMPRPAAARPGYRMHTLTVTGSNLAGGPDTGDPVFVLNVDGACLFCNVISGEIENIFYHGSAKFSVPAGHYFAFADFYDLSARGRLSSERLVILPQFTVTGSQTVRAAERSAKKITMVTPRPSAVQDTTLLLTRGTAPSSGVVQWLGFNWEAPVPLWATVVSRPATGELKTALSQVLASPAGSRSPYLYVLTHQSSGAFSPRYVVRPAGLATVAAPYYQAVGSAGQAFAGPVYPWEEGWLPDALVYPVRLPLHQTEYLTGGASLLWWYGYSAATKGTGQATRYSGGQYYPSTVWRAGERASAGWGAYPLHPDPYFFPPEVAKLDAAAGVVSQVSASRAGNRLSIDLVPFGDNQPGHIGNGLAADYRAKVGGSYQIDENGTKVAGGRLHAGCPACLEDFLAQATLSRKPVTVTLTLNAARTGSAYPLSPRSQTSWTWRSSRQPGAMLPGGYDCASTLIDGPSSRCAVQPLMTLRYAIAGLALNGTTRPGRQSLDLAIGHLQLAKAATITRATVQFSIDGGKTWRTARMTGHRGNYRAVYNVPAGAYVTLRTSAADTAAGAITETITRAYRVAPAGPAQPAGAAAGITPPRNTRDRPADGVPMRTACPPPRPGDARCMALYAPQTRVNAASRARRAGRPVPLAATKPQGWGPKSIESAYDLPVSKGAGQTIGIVDAFSTAHLAADLGVYRKEYGLAPCTTASGCLRIVNQAGESSPLPSPDPLGWGVEETLDVSMVSAACPRCKIIVVEARSARFADLATAENTAVRLGANVISNSYGARESGFTQRFAKAYGHRGHVIVAASAPLIAGVYGLAGNAASVKPGNQYGRAGALHDLTTGNNVRADGDSCGGDYLCTATKGYDGPTGLGTPRGTSAF